MHRSKFREIRLVMQRAQRGYRSHCAASRSRSAWSEAPRRHSHFLDIDSPPLEALVFRERHGVAIGAIEAISRPVSSQPEILLT
jgi:hypothetical protein